MESKQKPFHFGMAGAEFRFDAGYFAVATLDLKRTMMQKI
jgi:hypothetical protein